MERDKILNRGERDKVHKANKFYDKYMAGKWNEAEGEYNFDLSNVKKRKYISSNNSINCKDCGTGVRVQNNTKSFICSKCNSFNSID